MKLAGISRDGSLPRQVLLSELEEHVKTCEHGVVKIKCPKCTWTGPIGDLKGHVRSEGVMLSAL